MRPDERIYVAGHRGLVGSAIVRQLRQAGFNPLITRNHQELDLTQQAAVQQFFQQNKIDRVVLAAAKVGGIYANNTQPAEFIYQNLMMASNVIHSAWQAGIKHLLFLGSSCIYPKRAAQPMSESALLQGSLEPTNEPYAIAKIAGIKLCESYNRQYQTQYRAVMPTNLYGPEDNFHPTHSHVIPALIGKFHHAVSHHLPQVEIWGTGQARREFLHVDDMAEACIFVMDLDEQVYQQQTQPMCSHLNIGTGQDIRIQELADMLADISGFTGEIVYNHDKPDGAPRKLLNTAKINQLGWRAKIDLYTGLKQTYQWFACSHWANTSAI